MLNFTEEAIARVEAFLKQQKGQGVTSLRIAGNINESKLWLVKPSDQLAQDISFKVSTFNVVMDPHSAQALEGATVDFIQEMMQSGFRVFMPSPVWDDPLLQQVQEVLDREVNPGVSAHGGRVSLVGREEDAVMIQLEGGCQGCAGSQLTLKQGIEVMIRAAVPDITRIVDVTDHAAGDNPYFVSAEKAKSVLGAS